MTMIVVFLTSSDDGKRCLIKLLASLLDKFADALSFVTFVYGVNCF